MNFRLTLTLACLMLLLALGYFLFPSKPADTTVPGSATPMLATKPKDIDAITYTVDGDEQLKFVRKGTDWQMTAPVSAPVEKFQLQGISDSLKNIAYRQKFEPEATGYRTAEATGTAKPERVVKFTDDAGKQYTLGFGKETIDGVYVTLNDAKTIYLVDKTLLDSIDKKPDLFRDKSISTSDISRITGLTIKNQSSTATLTKSGDKWLISAPISARANATRVDEILREMSNITASGFTKLKRADARLDQPVATVSITVQNDTPPTTAPTTAATAPAGKTITLDLGVYTDISRKSAVYAALAGSDTVFTLRSDSFDKLNRELKDLRDPAVIAAPVANATDVTITTEGAPAIAVAKKESKWTMTSPVALDADPDEIKDYLGVISNLRAINYVDNAGNLKAIGLDPPHMKIDLTIPGQTQHEVLLVGKPETGEGAEKVTPVMRQGEPTVYLLQTGDAEKLATSILKLRDREMENVMTDRIRTIAIAGPSATPGVAATRPATTGPATAPAPTPGVTLQREGTHWTVTASGPTAAPVPADDVKISTLLAEFTPIEATKYLDDKAETSATPDITVTLTMVEPTLNLPPVPTTAPAAGPMPSTAPATASAAAATKPALADLPTAPLIAADPGKVVTHTLRLYHMTPPATAPTTAPATPAPTWKAVWDNQTPAWTFEPLATLVDLVSKGVFTVSPPTTAPAPAPAAPKSPF